MNRKSLLPFNRPQVEVIILEYIQLQLSDNVKARKLDKNLQNITAKGKVHPCARRWRPNIMVRRKLDGMGKEES